MKTYQTWTRGEPATALELENGTITIMNYVPKGGFQPGEHISRHMCDHTAEGLLVLVARLREISEEQTWTKACELLEYQIRHGRHADLA